MKRTLLFVLAAVALCASARPLKGKKDKAIDCGWCTVSGLPKSAEVGETFRVKVKLMDFLPQGEMVCFNMNYVKPWGDNGGLYQYQQPRLAEIGETLEYDFDVKSDPGAKELIPCLFFAKKGDANKITKQAKLPRIKVKASSSGDVKEKKPKTIARKVDYTPQTKDFGWCSVTVPGAVKKDGNATVSVTLKQALPAGENLSCHMHHAKEDGSWGGLYAMQPSVTPKVGETVKFTFGTNKNCLDLCPVLFVAPNGDFNKASKRANVPKIAFVIPPPTAAELAKQKAKEEAARARAEATRKPDSVTFKKSWMAISSSPSRVNKGETVTVKVQYHLDPSDSWSDGVRLNLTPLGPWIDNPDGVINRSRHHVGVSGFGSKGRNPIAVGDGVEEFTFTAGGVSVPCEVGFMAQFVGPDGKNFPWQTRGGGVLVLPEVNVFRVQADAPGGLFFYSEEPKLKVFGTLPETVGLKLVSSESEVVYEGDVPVKGDTIAIPKKGLRGVFLALVTAGEETRTCYFGTMPDVVKTLGGKRPPFGCTNLHGEDAIKTAGRMGFSFCRLFTGWAGLEPARGEWRLDGLDKNIDAINAAGMSPHILLTGAPEWVMPEGVYSPGFEPYPFDDDGWRASAAYLAKHYKGRIWGFEWLNEIVQGNKTATPVEDYLRFCQIGTEEVRKHAPGLQTQMAGGLWPRNFRLDLLRAGIAGHLDVLPIHYGTYDGIVQARNDFAACGGKRVWDNESARGYSTWGMDPYMKLTNSVTQSLYVMRNWPGELIGGAEAIVYFGGEANAAGNWTYLLDEHTPRPVAVTLALLGAKLGDARAVGATYLEPGALAYVFERKDGRGLAFIESVNEKSSCEPIVPVGSATSVKTVDYRGVESELPASGGASSVPAEPMPIIIEDFDMAELAAMTSLQIEGQDPVTPHPIVRLTLGSTAKVSVTVRNPLTRRLEGSLALKLGAKSVAPKAFALGAGETTVVDFDAGETSEDMTSGVVTLAWKDPSVKVSRKVGVNIVRPELLGNLVKNGNFERGTNKDTDWSLWGMQQTALPNDVPGYFGKCIEMKDNSGYKSAGQTVKLPASGLRYLYTAWVWTDNMYAGSNAEISDPEGKGRKYTIVNCFCAPKTTKGWQLMTKVFDAVDGSVKGFVQPVGQLAGKGVTKGFARYDNVRVTAYEGTDYAAEAQARTGEITIDGDLSDWDFSDPIPLLCENHVGGQKGGYVWDRKNLSGLAQIKWDKEALYFAAQVYDDQHQTAANEDTAKGDSITLALHPGNRVPGTDDQATEWMFSDCNPGGGSGKYTLYRPAAHCAGGKSGQLAKDSSVYEIVVKDQAKLTTYEVKIPWSEVKGVVPEVGTKLGLAIRLSDADGGKFGRINWGLGLDPAWSPESFGSLTLTK